MRVFVPEIPRIGAGSRTIQTSDVLLVGEVVDIAGIPHAVNARRVSAFDAEGNPAMFRYTLTPLPEQFAAA